MKVRLAFVVAALATILLGLTVHRGVGPLSPAARDVAGDALWAAMIAWWVGALAPRSRPVVRGPAALVVCWLVEFSQLVHTPTLDGWRATTLGRLVLGSGFDARDLAAYAAGVAGALLLERGVRRARERRA